MKQYKVMNKENIKQKEQLEILIHKINIACQTLFNLEKAKSTVGSVLGSDEKQEAKETKQKIHYFQRIILIFQISAFYNELNEIIKSIDGGNKDNE